MPSGRPAPAGAAGGRSNVVVFAKRATQWSSISAPAGAGPRVDQALAQCATSAAFSREDHA